MKRLYIIGQVSGMPNDNLDAFIEARNKLLPNHIVDIPHYRVESGTSWNIAMLVSIHFLTDFKSDVEWYEPVYDGIALLDGWEQSKGATLEKQVAEACGIPCKPWREWLEVSND